MKLSLDNFAYSVPEHLIAQTPLKNRAQARLMIVNRRAQTIRHDTFSQLADYLPEKSVLVINDSKVIPARLLGKKDRTSGDVEVFLLKKLSDGYTYETLMRPLRRIRNGDRIRFNQNGFYAEVIDREKRLIRFPRKNIDRQLNENGHMPLPPYIKRPDRKEDQQDYQTVYAKNKGSVAAPTAGLHFTNKMLANLERNGFGIEKVTLHINYGTFKPVEVSDITQHQMHSEEYTIAQSTLNRIQEAKTKGRTVVAVGTTSTRVLETVAKTKNLSGATNLFIYPGYNFKMTDALITNFHLPYSTLLMLVSAFGGQDLIARAYQEAINKKYRFYSYGDAMLII